MTDEVTFQYKRISLGIIVPIWSLYKRGSEIEPSNAAKAARWCNCLFACGDVLVQLTITTLHWRRSSSPHDYHTPHALTAGFHCERFRCFPSSPHDKERAMRCKEEGNKVEVIVPPPRRPSSVWRTLPPFSPIPSSTHKFPSHRIRVIVLFCFSFVFYLV